VTVVLAAVLLTQGELTALSALLGGLACCIPNAVFAWIFFARRHEANVNNLMQAFYSAEIIKLGFTASLFALIFINVKGVQPVPLFVSYLLVYSVHVVLPLIKK